MLFGVAAPTQMRARPPRLGVVVSVAEAGVRIDRVMPQSIAEATGLQVGDIIENAAGIGIRQPADLVAVIGRQAPGTWLPLQVRRGERGSEMLARFPAEP
jgi:S1-C subfamily serine protease